MDSRKKAGKEDLQDSVEYLLITVHKQPDSDKKRIKLNSNMNPIEALKLFQKAYNRKFTDDMIMIEANELLGNYDANLDYLKKHYDIEEDDNI